MGRRGLRTRCPLLRRADDEKWEGARDSDDSPPDFHAAGAVQGEVDQRRCPGLGIHPVRQETERRENRLGVCEEGGESRGGCSTPHLQTYLLHMVCFPTRSEPVRPEGTGRPCGHENYDGVLPWVIRNPADGDPAH